MSDRTIPLLPRHRRLAVAMLTALLCATIALPAAALPGTPPTHPDSNDPQKWELGEDWSCAKVHDSGSITSYTIEGQPPTDRVWVLLVLNAGQPGDERSTTVENPSIGTAYSNTQTGDVSNAILCHGPQGDTSTRVTAATPTFIDPTCAAPTPAVIATNTAQYTYSWDVSTVTPGSSVTVNAQALGNVTLEGATSWPHTFPTIASLDCPSTPPPPPPPAPPAPPAPPVTATFGAEATEVCLAIDRVELIEFETFGENISGDGTLTIRNAAGVMVHRGSWTVGDVGSIPWPLDDDGVPFKDLTAVFAIGDLSETVQLDYDAIAEECTLEVLPTEPIEEEPVEEPTEEPTEEPAVLPVVVEAAGPEVLGVTLEADALPRTGVPTLALLLSALLALGAGGTLLRRSSR